MLENLDSIDATSLDARLRRALRIEQRLLSEMAALLLDVARAPAYRWRGFPNLAAYARERLGMSPRKAQALLRLERAGDLCPELRAAFRSGELSWVQAHALVPVFALEHSQPWRAAWVAHAAVITVRRLEDDVERAIATGDLDPGSFSESSDSLSEEVQTGAHPTVPNETIHLFFTAPADVARLFQSVLATVQRRIERKSGRTASESEALDAMLEHCFAAWSPVDPKIPPDHRVFERDGWRCTVPGCTSYRNLHSHHIVFRSDNGPDDAWNRTALCAAHHHRCVHEGIGRIRIRGRAPDALR
ncbi:MAG: HNH endonuclease, partial [Myxococcota bacterium]